MTNVVNFMERRYDRHLTDVANKVKLLFEFLDQLAGHMKDNHVVNAVAYGMQQFRLEKFSDYWWADIYCHTDGLTSDRFKQIVRVIHSRTATPNLDEPMLKVEYLSEYTPPKVRPHLMLLAGVIEKYAESYPDIPAVYGYIIFGTLSYLTENLGTPVEVIETDNVAVYSFVFEAPGQGYIKFTADHRSQISQYEEYLTDKEPKNEE